MAQDSVTEYKIGPAIVRMHGQPDRDQVKAATEKFLNRVEQIRRERKGKQNGNHHANGSGAGNHDPNGAV